MLTHPLPSICAALQVGENPALATEFEAGVPVAEHVLLPKLTQLLVDHFGATPRVSVA